MGSRVNRHEWLAEPLLDGPDSVIRSMFGARAVYLRGLMVLVLADGEEPWRGLLFPVERERHEEVIGQWPVLRNHEILPKWLYLPEATETFEQTAKELIRRIAEGDPRFGVIPPKKRKKQPSAKSNIPNDGRPPHLM